MCKDKLKTLNSRTAESNGKEQRLHFFLHTMALPLLPGYSFPDPSKQDFKKTQAFGFKNGLVVNNISKKELYDTQNYEEPELPPITLLGPSTMTRSTRNEVKIDPYVPPDVKYYKQV